MKKLVAKIAMFFVVVSVGCFYAIGCAQPCQSDKDCYAEHPVCKMPNGVCVEKTQNTNTNNNPSNPAPQKACKENKDCKETQVCLSGFCHDKCKTNGDCRDSEQVCSKAPGNDEGVCKRPECTSDTQCNADEVCRANRCVPKQCQNDSVCPYQFICKKNKEDKRECVPGCRKDDVCGNNAHCGADDTCKKGCIDDENCRASQYCHRAKQDQKLGECKNSPKRCASSQDCVEGMICVNNYCKPEVCSDDNPCPKGKVCNSNRCVPTCEDHLDCEDRKGYICGMKDGRKQCIRGCITSSALCGGASVCKQIDPNCDRTTQSCRGVCKPADCEIDQDCPTGYTCYQKKVCRKKQTPEVPTEVPPTDGGTTPEPDTTVVEECGTDSQCKAANPNKPVCEDRSAQSQNNRCIVCRDSNDCKVNGLGNVCDRPDPNDTTKNRCVECVQNSDCSNGRICNDQNTCVPKCTILNEADTCKKVDASKPRCKVETSTSPATCVQCITNADCTGGKTCSNNVCVTTCTPFPEVCDGKDNDCNGKVDDIADLGKACFLGKGECRARGAYKCQGSQKVCTAVPGKPTTETCDGNDNDCDGLVDNNLAKTNQACTTGKLGVCATGKQRCNAGAWQCVQDNQPSKEICDGADNDCDGSVDEFSELNIRIYGTAGNTLTYWKTGTGNVVVAQFKTGAPDIKVPSMAQATSDNRIVRVWSCVLWSHRNLNIKENPQTCPERYKDPYTTHRTNKTEGVYVVDPSEACYYNDIGGGKFLGSASGMKLCSSTEGQTAKYKPYCCPKTPPLATDYVFVIGSKALLAQRSLKCFVPGSGKW